MRVPCQGPSFLVPGLPPATCRLCSKGQISARRRCCRSEPCGHLARPRHLRGGGGPGGREARAGEARDGRTAAAGASAPRRATVRRIVLPRGWACRRQRSLCPPWPRAETAPRGAPLPGSRRAPVTPGLRLRPAAQARGEGASFCGAGNTSEEPGRGGGGAVGALRHAVSRFSGGVAPAAAGGGLRGEKPARRHAATLASVPRRPRGPRFGYPFMSRGRDPGVWPCHR